MGFISGQSKEKNGSILVEGNRVMVKVDGGFIDLSDTDPTPDFAGDSIKLLESINQTEDDQVKLFEIVNFLSSYYRKGKESK